MSEKHYKSYEDILDSAAYIERLVKENAELKQENFHLKQVKEKWKIRFFKLHDLFDPNGLIEIE